MIIDNSIFKIPIVNNVIMYDETDSTNTRAKQLGNDGCVDGTLVIADTQALGRGRLGRSFSSPSGTGIYMSLLLRPKLDASKISQITLLAAMAVYKTISNIPGISPLIKWPNDIVADGKKLVGILTEASCDTALRYVIIGIGINVNNEGFPEELSQHATSLYLLSGKKQAREQLIYDVMANLSDYYTSFINKGSLSFIKSEYNRRLASFNKPVYLVPHEMTASLENTYDIDTSALNPCTCMGIDDNGDLICTQPDGTTQIVNSGEISVRGLSSYS